MCTFQFYCDCKSPNVERYPYWHSLTSFQEDIDEPLAISNFICKHYFTSFGNICQCLCSDLFFL